MSKLKSIIYLTQSDYTTLSNGGTITKSGHTLTGIDEDCIYITTDQASIEDLTGVLPVTHGGTGKNTLLSGQVLVGNGTNSITSIIKTNTNTANTLVERDGSGNFSAGTITASLTGNATTASRLQGFSSSGTSNASWGNQTGTEVCWANDASGGSYSFRRDNPVSGELSLILDGTVYIKEGNQNISEAVKSFSVSGKTITYTTLWGNTGTFTTQDTTYANGTGITIGTGNAINHSNSVTAQTTQAVYPIKIDAQGHINAYGSAITPVTTVNGHTGASVNVTADDLGLASALKYVGAKSSLPTATDSTTYSTYNNGDVITVSNKEYAYVKGSNAAGSSWVELGDEGSYKLKQTAFTNSTGTADGSNTSTTFIYSFSQDENGTITNIKTRKLPTYNNYSHPTGDGNLHVPATGTSNNGKVLKAGSTAGSISWGTLSASDVGAAPSSTVSCTTANVKSALSTGSDTTKFLNNKGEWAVPAYTTSLAWSAITSKPNLPTGNARIFYGTSSTAAGTAAKAVTCSIYDAYTTGDILVVKFDNANTAGSPTLNVNSKGAKNIRKIYNGAVSTLNANGEITGTCMFVYDGTQWILTNADYNNTYTIPTSFSITANATDGLWDITGTNGTNAVTYALAPYSSKGTTATFYTAATNPTLTTRLNYDGYLYATKLYSDGTEVSVSGHTHSYLSAISWSGDTNLKLKQSVNGATATDVLQFVAGSNITLTGASGKLTIAGTANNAATHTVKTTTKYYVTGTETATTSTGGDTFDTGIYATTVAGQLNATSYKVNENVTLQYNSTDSALEFVFA